MILTQPPESVGVPEAASKCGYSSMGMCTYMPLMTKWP